MRGCPIPDLVNVDVNVSVDGDVDGEVAVNAGGLRNQFIDRARFNRLKCPARRVPPDQLVPARVHRRSV